LLLVAHGIEGAPGIALQHQAAIADLGRFAKVRVACLKGKPDLAAGLRHATAPVHVVPLLMADGFIMDLLRRKLAGHQGLVLHPPVGTHPGLVGLIRQKALATAATAGWRPETAGLLLVGHGTPRHPESGGTTEAAAAALAAEGVFAAVRTAFLDQSSYLEEVAASLPDRSWVAVGLFLDEGPHGRDDVTAALAHAGVPVRYAGPIGTDPAIVELVLDRAAGLPQPVAA
jgi:sirohydrochlorin ferrochelatase